MNDSFFTEAESKSRPKVSCVCLATATGQRKPQRGDHQASCKRLCESTHVPTDTGTLPSLKLCIALYTLHMIVQKQFFLQLAGNLIYNHALILGADDQCLLSLKRGCWGRFVRYSMYTMSSPPDMEAMDPALRLTPLPEDMAPTCTVLVVCLYTCGAIGRCMMQLVF